MGFFSKLFARDPEADPFMPGAVVVVGGFGTGRIQRIDSSRGVECFVVRMDTLPPSKPHLYVTTDGSGFPMRVPVAREDAERQLSLLVPKHDAAEWEDLADAFAQSRQTSKSVTDLQRLLTRMYPSADLTRVEQRKMVEWVEDALFSELAVALGRSRDDLRAEVRGRFRLTAIAPRKSLSTEPLPEPPSRAGLAPIGSFAVTQGLEVSDPVGALEMEEIEEGIRAGDIPPPSADDGPLEPVVQNLKGRRGTWHAYVRRTEEGLSSALIAVHQSSDAGAPPTLRPAGSIVPLSGFVGIFDGAVAKDRELIGEEVEFSHENFPRIIDGRGIALDDVLPVSLDVLVGETEGEVVYVKMDFLAAAEAAGESDDEM